eukprot:1240005-Alexandrium_andersonii.AAC.1
MPAQLRTFAEALKSGVAESEQAKQKVTAVKGEKGNSDGDVNMKEDGDENVIKELEDTLASCVKLGLDDAAEVVRARIRAARPPEAAQATAATSPRRLFEQAAAHQKR